MDGAAIIGAVTSVTKRWAKQRKAEERNATRVGRRGYAMVHHYRTSIKDVAWDVMEEAYMSASAGGTLPAQARQIMYAARPTILEKADDCYALDAAYFTQQLLPDYMANWPSRTAGWDVVFDARGHLHEPHTGETLALGTLDVRNYLGKIAAHKVEQVSASVGGDRAFPTMGPGNRYGAILFVEKEGFMPLFQSVHLAEKYDTAIMSTKGMSNTAARHLVDELCGTIPLFVLHDFDKAGFSILATLQRSTRRYTFTRSVNVIDLGLRLEDVRQYDLQTEACHLRSDPTYNLRENGATEEEIAFLRAGQRVELNAFTSDKLIEWLEAKLQEHGLEKVVPNDATLEAAYRRAALKAALNDRLHTFLDEAKRKVEGLDVDVARLRKQVELHLEEDPECSWDQHVAWLAEEGDVQKPRKADPPTEEAPAS